MKYILKTEREIKGGGVGGEGMRNTGVNIIRVL
jgi:hypothetical protein